MDTTSITSVAPMDTTEQEGMPSDVQALYLMTKLKLDRFKEKKSRLDQGYARIMEQINTTLPLIDKIQVMYDEIRRLFVYDEKDDYLNSFESSLRLARASTSTSDNLLQTMYDRLLRILDGGKRRTEYNFLFGSIMSQWLQTKTSGDMTIADEEEENNTTAIGERLITNEKLETIIFDRPQLDLNQWRDFLVHQLFHFNNEKEKEAFDKFKLGITDYGEKTLFERKVTPDDIREAIDELLRNDFFDDHRKRLINKLKMDASAVEEFTSSLNLMINEIGEWNWPLTGVRGVFRRKLAGRYRCFYEEDFLTAVFLQYLGNKWSQEFKYQLVRLFDSLMGKNEDCSSDSIEYKRYKMRRDDYWVALLHSERDERHYPTTTTAYDGYDDGNGIVNMKQKLLYLVNVEIQLHQQLRPQQPFTVVCADMEWLGPSISHEVVQILLEVCGIPRIWLDFFDRFLKMPVYYQPGEPIRIRQRGCPMSHSLSFLFAELLLFAMDLYVYRNTQIFNYRLHDDFWFFDSQSENIQKAWQLMCEYADLTGLKLNKEKCGSIKIGDNATAAQSFGDAALPQNHVKWGFLYLQSNGRFTIQNDLLVPYLNEMKERLNGAKSIMAWVTIYNKYVAFFLRNFGKCANVLGTYHTQQTIKAFQYIHQYLFPDAHGNALTVLMQLIVDQFKPITNSSSDLSECWFYWPLTKGGLGLTNVYLEVFAIHIQLEMNAKLETFSTLPIKDKQLYDDLIIHFQSLIKKRSFDLSKQFPDRYLHDDNTFITFDEYIKQREAYMPHWTHVYETLLEITQPALPQPTSIVNKYHLSQRRRRTRNISMNDAYSEWLAYYYGQQLEDTFNQLDFIDSQSLPIGLISTMKASQINWDKGRKVYKRQHSSDTR